MKEFSNSQACHVHFKSAWYSVLKTVLDKDIETTVHKQEVMPYGHLITATVMTLGVCQGQSLIFFHTDKHVARKHVVRVSLTYQRLQGKLL